MRETQERGDCVARATLSGDHLPRTGEGVVGDGHGVRLGEPERGGLALQWRPITAHGSSVAGSAR